MQCRFAVNFGTLSILIHVSFDIFPSFFWKSFWDIPPTTYKFYFDCVSAMKVSYYLKPTTKTVLTQKRFLFIQCLAEINKSLFLLRKTKLLKSENLEYNPYKLTIQPSIPTRSTWLKTSSVLSHKVIQGVILGCALGALFCNYLK